MHRLLLTGTWTLFRISEVWRGMKLRGAMEAIEKSLLPRSWCIIQLDVLENKSERARNQNHSLATSKSRSRTDSDRH
jgi:hypothetical protein